MIFDRFLKCLKPVIRATEAVSDDRRIYKRRIQLNDRCTSRERLLQSTTLLLDSIKCEPHGADRSSQHSLIIQLRRQM